MEDERKESVDTTGADDVEKGLLNVAVKVGNKTAAVATIGGGQGDKGLLDLKVTVDRKNDDPEAPSNGTGDGEPEADKNSGGFSFNLSGLGKLLNIDINVGGKNGKHRRRHRHHGTRDD